MQKPAIHSIVHNAHHCIHIAVFHFSLVVQLQVLSMTYSSGVLLLLKSVSLHIKPYKNSLHMFIESLRWGDMQWFSSFFYLPGVLFELSPLFVRNICIRCSSVTGKYICPLGQSWTAPVCPRWDGCRLPGQCSDSRCFEVHKTVLDSLLAPAGPKIKYNNIDVFREEEKK